MNRKRKIQAAIAAVLFGALYATGWLWPLVYITLSLGGAAAVLFAIFLAVQLAVKARQKDDVQRGLGWSDFVPLLGAVLGALLAFLSLAAVPTSKLEPSEPRTTLTSEASKSDSDLSVSPSHSKPNRPQASQRLGPGTGTGTEVGPASQAAAEFLGALLGAGAEQQRRQQADPRYQRFKQSLEHASVCPRCGGAGVYRYVDGNGVLQSRACPSCYGSGRAQ